MSEKREILEALDKLMEKYPDMRIGQLVTNVTYWAKTGKPSQSDVWDITNRQWLDAAVKHLAK